MIMSAEGALVINAPAILPGAGRLEDRRGDDPRLRTILRAA
jgi:hypothetical protein